MNETRETIARTLATTPLEGRGGSVAWDHLADAVLAALAAGGANYREEAEALIADLRARLSHTEAVLAETREEVLTRAALDVDHLFLNVEGFNESWDRGYRQGVQDSAYAVRELRGSLRAALVPVPGVRLTEEE